MTTYIVSKTQKAILLLALGVLGALLLVPTQADAACNAWNDLKTPSGATFDPMGGHSYMQTTASNASIEVKNFAAAGSGCTYSIHIASYKVFDAWGTPQYLTSQTLFADTAVSIAPQETKSISVGHPSSCAYQADFFEGPAAPATNPDFAALPAYKLFDWGGTLTPLCGPHLTVTKTVINNNGGTALVSAFPLFVNTTPVTSGVSNYFHAGTYTVSETNLPGYTAGTWGGDCAANGSVTLSGEQNKTCTITNDDTAAPFTCSASPNPQIAGVQSVTFTAVGGQFTPNYDWQFPGAQGQYTFGTGNPGITYYTEEGTKIATVHNYPTGGNWNSPGALTATCSVVITPAPSVVLTARQSNVGQYTGGPVVLPNTTSNIDIRWATTGSSNLTSCTSSASPTHTVWTNNTSRAKTGGQLNGVAGNAVTRTLTITCTKTAAAGGGTVSDSVTVTVPGAPTVDLTVRQAGTGTYGNGPLALPAVGGSVDLQWTTTNSPATCTASASPVVTGWSGAKGVLATNTQTGIVHGTTATRTYTILCTNTAGSATDSVTVTVPGAPLLLTCSPTPVTVPLNTNQLFTATNGSGNYSWTGGETPPTGGNTSTFTTQWSTDGPKSVVVTRGTEQATCAVTVSAAPVVLACLPAMPQVGVRVPASITAQGAVAPYTWNTGGGVGPVCAPSVSPCTQAYANANTKTVTLTNSNGEVATCQVVVKGSVTVRSNQPTSWSLSRPNGQLVINETDVTTKTYANQIPGVYTISGVPALSGFTGPVITPVTASQSIPQTGADIEFRITYTPECVGDNCPGDDDDDTGKYLNLQAGEENGPLSEGPVKVLYNHKAVLSWATKNVVSGSCTATGGWTGDKVDNGVELSKVITDETLETFTLTCTKQGANNGDALGTVSDSVQIGTRPPQCSDDKNNDDDKFVDWDGGGVGPKDPGCVNAADDNEADQVPECRDGYDNADPEDTDADKEDPGCRDEAGEYNPNDNDETDKSVGTATQCNNGLDDDGDGDIDYITLKLPKIDADKGCSSEWDPSELDDPNIREI